MSKDTRKIRHCQQCGNEMLVQKSKLGRKKFCSRRCSGIRNVVALNATKKSPKTYAHKISAALKGNIPWNKGKKGLQGPSSTSFQKGHTSTRRAAILTITTRPDKKGHLRSWIKIAEPNVWKPLAVYIWERDNGTVPSGRIIHHKDRNALNDSPDNLMCLTRSEHIAEHRTDLKR